MVAHLGARTHELLYEEIGNIIAEILSAWEKAECYDEVATFSSSIFASIQNNSFWVSYVITSLKIENMLFWIKVKICWEWGVFSIVRSPSL